MADKKPDYKPAPPLPGTREHDDADKRARDERDDAERGRDERLHEEHRASPPANRDQDPSHPANTTLARDLNAPTTFSIPPEDMLTEQEKAAVGSVGVDGTAGVGPVSPAEHTTGPVETIEDQGIGPRTPYPSGDPPPPEQTTTLSQGIKGASDRPHREPGEVKGPAGRDDEQAREHPANPGPFDPPQAHKVPSP